MYLPVGKTIQTQQQYMTENTTEKSYFETLQSNAETIVEKGNQSMITKDRKLLTCMYKQTWLRRNEKNSRETKENVTTMDKAVTAKKEK